MTGVPHSLENTKSGENISEGALFLLHIMYVPLPSETSWATIYPKIEKRVMVLFLFNFSGIQHTVRKSRYMNKAK